MWQKQHANKPKFPLTLQHRAQCLLLLIPLFWSLGCVQPAEAASCRTFEGHSVCIIKIQRSAKFFWEYRVLSRIDNLPQPEIRYNCRDRLQTQQNQPPLPFEPKGVGEWICHLLRQG